MVETDIAGDAAAANTGPHGAEVAGHRRVKPSDAGRARLEVGRGHEHVHERLHLVPQLPHVLDRGELLLVQDVAPHAADQVQAVGLAGSGEQHGQVHGLLANPEEVLESRIEPAVVAHQPQVQQMRVQTLDLQQDGADVLGAHGHLDALGVFHRLGVGHRVALPQMPQMRSARNVTAS